MPSNHLISYRSGPNVVWKESMVILYMSSSDVGFTLTISGGYTAKRTLVSRCGPHLTAPSHKATITHNGNTCKVIDWSLATSKLCNFCGPSPLSFSPIGAGSHTNVVHSVWGQSFQCVDVPRCVAWYSNTTFYV